MSFVVATMKSYFIPSWNIQVTQLRVSINNQHEWNGESAYNWHAMLLTKVVVNNDIYNKAFQLHSVYVTPGLNVSEWPIEPF